MSYTLISFSYLRYTVPCHGRCKRFYAMSVVKTKSVEDAVLAFQFCWVSQFWTLSVLLAAGTCWIGTFQVMLHKYDVKIRLVPQARREKNILDSRNGSAQFFQLQHAVPAVLYCVTEIEAVRITTGLYGSDVFSAFEAAKAYTSPALHQSNRMFITTVVLEANANLLAHFNPTPLMQSYMLKLRNFRVGLL